MSGKSPVMLAVQPNTRGMGYAVFAVNGDLLDFGMHDAPKNKNRRCLTRFTSLLATTRPRYVVLEDVHAHGARRGERIMTLIGQLANAAMAQGCEVIKIARLDVQAYFLGFETGSKDDIASAVSVLHPALKERLPKRRMLWDSERYRMGIFDAVAFGVTAQSVLAKEAE